VLIDIFENMKLKRVENNKAYLRIPVWIPLKIGAVSAFFHRFSYQWALSI
jgi:hypothetical protein